MNKLYKFISFNFGMKDMWDWWDPVDHDCKITDGISLTQSHYIEKLIKKYGHEDEKAKSQLHIILVKI